MIVHTCGIGGADCAIRTFVDVLEKKKDRVRVKNNELKAQFGGERSSTCAREPSKARRAAVNRIAKSHGLKGVSWGNSSINHDVIRLPWGQSEGGGGRGVDGGPGNNGGTLEHGDLKDCGQRWGHEVQGDGGGREGRDRHSRNGNGD